MNEKKRLEDNKNVSTIIDQMFRAWGLEGRMEEMDIIKAWPELMGEGVAHRTEQLSIRNKILHIKMNSSVMRDELAYGKAVIIQRINQFAGKEVIIDVWFK